MDAAGDPGTDAASINPVSSLRAKFEGLRPPSIKPGDAHPVNESITVPKPTENRQAPPIRASLDLPRPDSTWTANRDPGYPTPRTPTGIRRDGESPPRPGHKRPISMHIQSSPQLTPAVNVESPRSPPHTYFNRSASRSPERIDNTPFGKVRELISQHSSRESTRPSTPRVNSEEPSQLNTATLVDKAPNSKSRSRSPRGPAVNRAEKPKIPAKPVIVTQLPRDPGLIVEPNLTTIERQEISPFNTPPSSDGNRTPPPELESKPQPPQSKPVAPKVPAARRTNHQAGYRTSEQSAPAQPADPRTLGFNTISTPVERKDPRFLGFSAVEAPRPPSRDSKPSALPARANTVNERSTKDPRELGLGPGKPTPRHVSENIRQTSPATPQSRTSTAQSSVPQRDPRQLGFSTLPSTPLTIQEEPTQTLQIRQAPRPPPPRPSEESKHPTYLPGIRPPKRPSPQNTLDTPLRSSAEVPRQVTPNTSDVRFPPPPKRHTFNDADELRRADVQPDMPSRSKPMITAEPGRIYEEVPSSRHHSVSTTDRVYESVPQWDNDSDEAESSVQESVISRTDYPDSTQSNRRPPLLSSGLSGINGRGDSRVFDMCGQFLCTAGYTTRVFEVTTGEAVMSLNHGDTVKITAAIFKPATSVEATAKRLWLGNNIGELQEIDIDTHSVIASTACHNRREIVRILRHHRDLWTLDDEGKLFVWRADESGSPSMKYSHIAHKTVKNPTFAMVVDDKIWVAAGRELRIYRPGKEASFSALTQPLSQPNTGDITSGTRSDENGGRAYFGHNSGMVSIYSTKTHACVGVVKVSDYKINGLEFVGDKLWAVYKTGKVYVYDTTSTPWKVKKDWKAHDGPAMSMLVDPSSLWTLQKLQVATIGHDGYVRLWDGMLEDDWMEQAMQERDREYCTFRELRAAVITWNVGATNPTLVHDDEFIAGIMLADAYPPDIIAFGFQEVVDLEDRTVTAKSLLGFGKKKDPVKNEQHQSRIYREWRDHLSRRISRYCPDHTYTEVSTSSLIGLFQCIFIRQSERPNLSSVCTSSIKCGMGGHYGNKGALVTRFVIDDSSLCFINCHLAAGQSQTSHRNNDIATIFESEALTPEPKTSTRSAAASHYIGGGNGSQILDHEICILNGDLNYRIDAIPRDTVVKMIQRNELSKLLERDQINVSRRRVAGFRLATFTELPIQFAPTYKYDVGTDNYDSSEKKRSPAWCDRVLYRGFNGTIKQLEYRRHDGVRYSDHRPVSGTFRIRIKSVNKDRRDAVWTDCSYRFKERQATMMEELATRYLIDALGLEKSEARRLLGVGGSALHQPARGISPGANAVEKRYR